MGWSEASIHRWLARQVPSLRGAAADASELSRSLARPVVCVDQTVEGVHCTVGTDARAIGRKACSRALSDLAASAAVPRAVLLAILAPPTATEARLRALITAVAERAGEYGAELVGGDTGCSPGPLSVAVTAVGERGAGVGRVRRDGARPGDVVVATGPFGGSLLGRHLAIEPRSAEGLWLARLGARAMLDVSDSLALDLARMARASRVRIDLERVPVHPDARRAARRSGRSALSHALFDGEDHELIASLPRATLERALRESAERCPRFEVLGRVRRGAGLRVPSAEVGGELARWDGRGGYVHGGA